MNNATEASPSGFQQVDLEPCPLCGTAADRQGEALFCTVGCPLRECGIRISMVGNYRIVDSAWNKFAKK